MSTFDFSSLKNNLIGSAQIMSANKDKAQGKTGMRSSKDGNARVKELKEMVKDIKSFKLDEDGQETKQRKYTKKQRLEKIRAFIEDNYVNEEKELNI